MGQRPEFTLALSTSAGDFEFRYRTREVNEGPPLLVLRHFERWFQSAVNLIETQGIFGQLLVESTKRCPEAMKPLGVDWLSVTYDSNGTTSECDLRSSSLAKERT